MSNFVKKRLTVLLVQGITLWTIGVLVITLTKCQAIASQMSDRHSQLVKKLLSRCRHIPRDRIIDIAALAHLKDLQRGASAARTKDVRKLLVSHGDDASLIKPLAVLGPSGELRDLRALEQLGDCQTQRHMTHYGLAETSYGVVLLLVRRLISVQPIRRTAKQNEVVIQGHKLFPGPLFAYVVGPCKSSLSPCIKQPHRVPIQMHLKGHFSALFDMPSSGWWTLEIVADAGFGPEVAMLRQLWVSRELTTPVQKNIKNRPASSAWFPPGSTQSKVNRIRKTLGELPLELDDRLGVAAQNHARDVCLARWAVHTLPQRSRPEIRARLAGYQGPILENVAIGSTLREAWRKLLTSPAHLQSLAETTATRVGIGVVQKPTLTCLVILFGLS